jgi:hydrogenase maturation protein HypF
MHGLHSALAMRQTAFRIRIEGTVQGVGFRPAVWQLAHDMQLAGTVCNDGGGVLIEVWAETSEPFIALLKSRLPPLARIGRILVERFEGNPPAGFEILCSGTGRITTAIAPDAATCPDCLAEMRDPAERRHGYAFTNCTHCGPRLSIIKALPYDRANTTMADFALCLACKAEYGNPADRRFHAQPIACPQCGPKLWFETAGEVTCAGDGIDLTAAAIAQGRIIAVKGLGGFHLACDAANAEAVRALRQRKKRSTKPFAMMAPTLEAVQAHAHLDEAAAALLQSSAAPIVLLTRRVGSGLPEDLAPGQGTWGFMLPYTPLHHLLMQKLSRVIVLTSANLSDDPQVTQNVAAREELQHIADGFLMHDRDIAQRVDDSVVRLSRRGPIIIRRARGLAPQPLPLHGSFDSDQAVLAMGADLKGAIALGRHGAVTLSQHLGDLATTRSREAYDETLSLLMELHQAKPSAIAVDLHPQFHSRSEGERLAATLDVPLLPVQHHHAHIAACMADNELPLDAEPVLGIALDGTGLGSDGTIWGGEFMKCTFAGYERLASFDPVPLPGGDRAARQPWRNTYAHLRRNGEWQRIQSKFGHLDIIRRLAGKPLALLDKVITGQSSAPLCSSAGRLFDACAALLGICFDQQEYEGEAPALLESLAARAPRQQRHYMIECGPKHIHWGGLFEGILTDIDADVGAHIVARRIHETISHSCAVMAARLAEKYGLSQVALSGGCFNNALLLDTLSDQLASEGLEVLVHRVTPCGDGGLALGQAAVALRHIRTSTRPRACI